MGAAMKYAEAHAPSNWVLPPSYTTCDARLHTSWWSPPERPGESHRGSDGRATICDPLIPDRRGVGTSLFPGKGGQPPRLWRRTVPTLRSDPADSAATRVTVGTPRQPREHNSRSPGPRPGSPGCRGLSPTGRVSCRSPGRSTKHR